MNEKIKQLAERAGSTHKQNLGVYQFFEHELEKFAELIVKECINVIEKNHPEFTCKEDQDNLIRKAGRMDAIDEIREHFGVEE